MDLSTKMWEFKYAPKTFDDLILPEKNIKLFKQWIEDKNIDNCLLVSQKPGSGKTSVSRILQESKLFSCIYINASTDTSIDVVRTKIKTFVKTVSPMRKGAPKIVILDEADRLSSNAADALKGEIEGASKNARFLFTANRLSAFPDPILSRLNIFNFDTLFVENKKELQKKAYLRMCHILDTEGIKYDKKVVVEVIKRLAPDWRNVIRTLQMMSAYDQTITEDSATSLVTATEIDSLVDLLKKKQWNAVREASVKFVGREAEVISTLYGLTKTGVVKDEFCPHMVLNLGEFNRYYPTVMDAEIELMMTLTNIMTDVEFN